MPDTVRRDYEYLRKANETMRAIDDAAAEVAKSRTSNKGPAPMDKTRWLGFFFIMEILKRPIPESKVAVVAVPEYDRDAEPQYFLLDATTGITPRIRKNTVIPITEVTFGKSCSYLAE